MKQKSGKKRNKTESMLSARSQLMNILFVLLILAATFIFLFNSIYDPAHPIKGSDFSGINWLWLLPALLCLALSISFEAANLWLLCRKVGYPRSFRQSTVYASSDIYFSAITPSATGGQPAAAYYMTKSGVPLSLSTAILILNVTLYTVGLLVISAFALIFRPDFFARFSGLEQVCVLVGMIFHGILIAFCLICMFSRRFVFFLGDVAFGLLAKLRIVKNKEERVAAFRASVSTYRSALSIVREHRWLLPVLFFNAVMQRVILAPITYFVFLAMAPLGVPSISFFEVFTMQLYCTVGASAIPLPGGAGIAETLYMGIFDSFMPGVPGATSLCILSMLLSRFCSSYLAIIVCGTITITHHLRMKRAEFNRRRMAPPFDQLVGADDEDEEELIAALPGVEVPAPTIPADATDLTDSADSTDTTDPSGR